MAAEARRAPFAWIAALSFASGLPFGLVNEALPVFLRARGTALVDIGLVTAATFPWTFKFLWAPLVDRLGRRRDWIAACLAAIALAFPLLARLSPEAAPRAFWALLVLVVTLSATQDIAIDAYTIETTPHAQLGVANSVRIGAYRCAMFVAGGFLVWLAGRASWDAAFLVAAVATGALAVATLLLPSPPRAESAHADLWAPLRALLARPGVGAVLAFALLFKLGDAAMEPMTRPFWVDRGFSLEEIGAVLTTGRMVATLAGAMLGGVLTSRLGIGTALWTLGLLQAGSNLGYWAAAATAPSKPLVVAVAFFENFAGGMGTAAFVAFLMSMCEQRFAATQYALLSALLALTRALAGAISGALATRLGYAPYFLLTFLLALPAYALIPLVRRATPAPTPGGP